MIEFVNVTKKYKNGTTALDDVNLKIDEGQFIYLIGPSGAGKSTLLKLAIREEKPTSGKVLLDSIDVVKLPNRKIPKLRRNIGMIFQDFKLLLKKTVWENVAFALEVSGEATEPIKVKTSEVLMLLEKLNKMGTTIVMATHKEDLTKDSKHRFVKIENGRLESKN